MKIAVLSTNPKLYSTSRLVEAGKERGHKMVVLNHKRCYMNITTMRPSIHYKGEAVEGVDAIIPRIGASVSFYGTAVVRQFEMMGVYSVNESVAITRSRDKLRALQLLSRKGIGLPVTGFANSPDDTEDLLDGDKVVAAMKRTGREGEFRSNLHRGGSAQLVRITPEERSTAVRSAKIMGLNVAGVDLLRSNHGPVVMEVNVSPGLEGIEKATGKDVASLVIQFIEKNARPGRTKSRGHG